MLLRSRRAMATALIRTVVASALRPLLPPSRCLAAPRALLARPPPAAAPAAWPPSCLQPAVGFKTKGVIRKRCRDCYRVKRRGRWFIYCKTNPKHKQRQM